MKMADSILYGLETSHQFSVPRPSPVLFVNDKILVHPAQNLKLSEFGSMLRGKMSQRSFCTCFLGRIASKLQDSCTT